MGSSLSPNESEPNTAVVRKSRREKVIGRSHEWDKNGEQDSTWQVAALESSCVKSDFVEEDDIVAHSEFCQPGAEAQIFSGALSARLKPRPFKARKLYQQPFNSGAKW